VQDGPEGRPTGVAFLTPRLFLELLGAVAGQLGSYAFVQDGPEGRPTGVTFLTPGFFLELVVAVVGQLGSYAFVQAASAVAKESP
jgi:hypothetical protein